jgi:hypothetical protein
MKTTLSPIPRGRFIFISWTSHWLFIRHSTSRVLRPCQVPSCPWIFSRWRRQTLPRNRSEDRSTVKRTANASASIVRSAFIIAGAVLCLLGAGLIFYQLSESCEDSLTANHVYPWCSDVLDHVNLTFGGVLILFGGVMVLALGGTLHWVLEKSRDGVDDSPPAQGQAHPWGSFNGGVA